MIRRRTSLQQALSQVETGVLADVTTIVISRAWWDALSPRAQDGYRTRSVRQGIRLLADDRLSPYYVEVTGSAEGAALSAGRRLVNGIDTKPRASRTATSKERANE